MSFLKNLFGLGGANEADATPKVIAEEEYKGYRIAAVHMSAGGEFQLAGWVKKEVDGETKVHNFVRADRLPSKDDVAVVALDKARQLVDEQGDSLFR